VKVNRINWSALVDVLANKAVTLEPIVTSARVASWVVGASCVIVTNSWDECTLIIVSTETVCSVSRISSVTSTVPAGNFIKTEGVCITIMLINHVCTFVNIGAVGCIADAGIPVSPVTITVEAAVSIRASSVCMAIVRQFH